MHVKMCGVNLTRQCFLVQKHVDQFYRIGTRSAVFAAQLVEYFMDATEKNASLAGANIHDACAVAWLIDEKLIQAVPMHITVELKGEFTRGMTVCDYRHLRGPNRILTCTGNLPWISGGKNPMQRLRWNWILKVLQNCWIKPWPVIRKKAWLIL